ncbi:nitroreductase family protein [Formicincola oecophyllae]|uniref:Nitroreductase family protein n=1 Tax=Formicincola oecophyllae TaxID=2558361 RepID=A0A4Y6U6R2_9PROT|nr:nitroreductase family protein [Formicincola oecophyllae]QDH13053.1 nitroreductase family protein [Formicincola oecophyllae]
MTTPTPVLPQVLEAITRRRAVHDFTPNDPVPDDVLKAVMEATRLAPTAYNIQNYRFVLVRDQKRKEALRALSFNQPPVSESSVVVVVCAADDAWRQNPERYFKGMPAARAESYIQDMMPAYFAQPNMPHDEGIRSGALGAMALMLAAQAYGLQSLPMTGIDFAAVGQFVKLPPNHQVVMLVALGHQMAAPGPRLALLPYDEVVLEEAFPGAG